MTTSDYAVMAFVAALGAWAVQPRRQPAVKQWVFPTPRGSRLGLRVPGATVAEIASNIVKSDVFAGHSY